MRCRGLVWAVAFSVLAGGRGARADNFSILLDVDGARGFASFTTISDTYDALSTQGLQRIVAGYTETSAATAAVNLRGIPAIASFAAGSPFLRVQVPGPGIDELFLGATREESRRLFEDWLKGRGASNVNSLLRYGVRTTGGDPIAGNPAAAMNQFVAQDFGRAIEAELGGGAGFGMGIRFSLFSTARFDTRQTTLPLNYTWEPTRDDTIEFDAPIAYSDINGAASYGGSFGILYRRRIFEWWSLQPSLRVGAAGSADLGGGSGIYSLALHSTLRFNLPAQFRIAIINGLTYISTFPVSVGRYSIDYDLTNLVFRNGIVLSRNLGLELRGRPVTGSLFAIDTRFTGDAVYVRSYQEFGFFLSWGRESGPIRAGLTYLTGERGTRGLTFNAGIEF
jgi:hypothetical protein